MPGAVEALSHWRVTIEELITTGVLEPMVAADLGLVNMCGNVEWPNIQDALNKHFPEALPWTAWQQSDDCITRLPSGAEVQTDRGAE